MNNSIITADNISCGYGDNAVIKRLSLTVEEASFIGVIGPNGSGKSTLVKALTAVLPLMEGGVRLLGKDIQKMSTRQIARSVAVIPQETSIFFPFTIEEIVGMGRHPHVGRFRRISNQDLDIVEQAMQYTDTLHLRDRCINNISGGERQRAVIARALAQQPRVLFLDEPTSHLDINHQVEIFDLMKKLNREQRLTVFAVTHDLNLCAEYCQFVYILKDGAIAGSGTPGQILTGDTIKSVYGAEVEILTNPRSGSPIIVPVSGTG